MVSIVDVYPRRKSARCSDYATARWACVVHLDASNWNEDPPQYRNTIWMKNWPSFPHPKCSDHYAKTCGITFGVNLTSKSKPIVD